MLTYCFCVGVIGILSERVRARFSRGVPVDALNAANAGRVLAHLLNCRGGAMSFPNRRDDD